MAGLFSRGLKCLKVFNKSPLINRVYNQHLVKCFSLMPRLLFHTTEQRGALMEFFDEKENWAESKVTVGRPWKKDELRIKSNSDLHKLWYVLLKERNMLMTMEEEYHHQGEVFPNPERFEKVEESMENLLSVVAERNRAYNLLETGHTGEPGYRWTINELGLGYWRRETEHHLPMHINSSLKKKTELVGPWVNRYLRLWREKSLVNERKAVKRREHYLRKLKEVFPDAEID